MVQAPIWTARSDLGPLILFHAIAPAKDEVHAAALLWVAGIGHYVAGNVDLRTVSWG